MLSLLKLNQTNLVCFLESTSSGDIWKVIIIEEGLSKNGKYYTKEALQNAIPLFEKSKVCFYEWQDKHYDHIPLTIEKIRPEGFPLQTAGYLDNVKYETIKVEGREVSGLTGSLHLLENNSKVKDLKNMLVNAWQKGLKNFLGLSINAEGPSSVRMLNGQPVTVVNGISKVFSTDFVTQPAAGGGLLKIIESLNIKGGVEQMFKKILEALQAWNPKLLESVDIANITEEEVISIFEALVKTAKEKKSDKCKELEGIVKHLKDKKYDEAERLLNEVIKMKEMTDEELVKAPDNTLSPEQLKKKQLLLKAQSDAANAGQTEAKKKQEEIDKKSKDLEARISEIDTQLKTRECKEMLELALGESNLPEPIKNKIRNTFKNKITKEAEIKESIKGERDTLAQLIESKAVMDFGDVEGTFVERAPVTRLQASLDLMLGVKPTEAEKEKYKDIDGFTSLREAYVAYTDDPGITGRLGPKAISRLSEALDDNTSLAYALGYSMQRRMLPEYKGVPELWKKIAVSTPIKDFKLQERIQWGGFGVLPTVQAARTVAGTPIDSETPSYPELGFPADQEATYAVATKGGIITITRRMIIDDDLKVLSAIPKKVGKAAGYTLNQFVFDLMIGYGASGINTATIYDKDYAGSATVLYVANHKNYRTGALGYDNLQDLLNDMWYQCELGYKTDVTTEQSASSTALIVTTTAYIKAGDYLWLDGEIERVDSVTNTTTLVVTRGLFNTTGAIHYILGDVRKVSQFLALEKPILWVPRSLNGTALALQNSDKNPENAEGGINTLKGQFEVQQSPFLRGDENNYYLSAKPGDVEGIEIGFLNGKEEPEILVQDQPTQGNVFLYDTIRYKVRHEYGGAVVDFRAFAGAIVS